MMIPSIAIIISAYAIARLATQCFHGKEPTTAQGIFVFLISVAAILVIIWQLLIIVAASQQLATQQEMLKSLGY